jgi:superoxide dismutase, Cu-Zn family
MLMAVKSAKMAIHLLSRAVFVMLFVYLYGGNFAQAQMSETVYELPGDMTFPEGIAYRPGTSGESSVGEAFFVGSAVTGAIYRVYLNSGEVETFIEGTAEEPFQTLGMAIDSMQRLWVAGGLGGEIRRYDLTASRDNLAVDIFEVEAGLLNDVDVTSRGDAFFTDSFIPVVYRIAADANTVEPWLDLTGTPFEYQEGTDGNPSPNANGIVVTPDDQYLIIVQMNTGQLYRITIETREVVEISLDGEPVTGGDGLVLAGHTLYVVRQPANNVAVIEMEEDYASGTLVSTIESETFMFPATAAIAQGRLLVVNTQFNALEGQPNLPFTVSSIPLED